MTELYRPIPVPCLTSKKVLVSALLGVVTRSHVGVVGY